MSANEEVRLLHYACVRQLISVSTYNMTDLLKVFISGTRELVLDYSASNTVALNSKTRFLHTRLELSSTEDL